MVFFDKRKIISGDLTYEQGRSEIFAYYTKSDTTGPVTVGEMLVEEFLKPLNMSHDQLAEAMGSILTILSVVCVVLQMMRLAFLLPYLGLVRTSGVICRSCKIIGNNDVSN